MTIILERKPQKWSCPNCPVYAVTFGQSNRFHRCSGLAGLLVQMVPAGTPCKIEAVEREDWIKDAVVPRDADGRPVAATVITRDDGSDVTAYAPTVHAETRRP